jgi:hypothetical protein
VRITRERKAGRYAHMPAEEEEEEEEEEEGLGGVAPLHVDCL